MNVLLELIRLNDLACSLVERLGIIFLVLLDDIFANVAKTLLYFLRNIHGVFGRNSFTSITHLLEDELCDIFASKWNVLNAAANDEAV